MKDIELCNGNCLELMDNIPDKSVDMMKPNEDDCCVICNTYLKDDNNVEGVYCPNCGQKVGWQTEN